jgi:hypothetical protein
MEDIAFLFKEKSKNFKLLLHKDFTQTILEVYEKREG